jgi:acyl-CoA synthetase (AMP-forming)/AMP-acid ligase II
LAVAGRNDGQERDQPLDRSRRWQGEERNDERGDRWPPLLCSQETSARCRGFLSFAEVRKLDCVQTIHWRTPAVRRAHAVVAPGWRCYGYVWFVACADDVITSAAYRIGPFEVESALVEHPAVAEAAVVGKPNELRERELDRGG